MVNEKPEIEIDLPRRKPLEAMQAPPAFPDYPANTGKLIGEEQARVVVDAWNASGEAYGVCVQRHASLVEWIRGD